MWPLMVYAFAACVLVLLSVKSYAGVPRFAYVANSKDNTVSIYTVDAATGLQLHNSYVLSGTAPLGVVVATSGKFMYVVNSGSNNVSAFL
jgi:DNA-binding beta-propeller fold protein YncE